MTSQGGSSHDYWLLLYLFQFLNQLGNPCLQDLLQLGGYSRNLSVLVQILLTKHLCWALLGFRSINAKAACLRRQ